jgi:hypothetical protein
MQTLEFYSKRLAEENTDDLCAALAEFQERPREEGESALPDVGTILGLVRVRGRIRKAKQRDQAGERFVRWNCPECRSTITGFVPPGADLTRYCKGIPQCKHEGGEHCGVRMAVGYDELAKRSALRKPVEIPSLQ